MTRFVLLSAALALTTAGTAGASVQAPVEVVGERIHDDQLTERVRYGDLELAGADGQRALTFRVRSAVSKVCAPLDGTNLRTRHQQCRSVAWHGAKPQMARAIERAQQLAATGSTSLPEVAIAVRAPAGF
ncbi:MAG: hypothetical protein AVDCRST_MAG31-925 [uncultured Sphingomonas sp.]|uniref:UrcA family protein n=1 Tax=uncultured Sphingomonas sp. TaxID=158754 RepID=A0A6J4T2U4_9SPHN|nr:UrcA family protein [uncultured Sphingomonas sp.]CAA9511584.1 MAG: hypothetical protein AVDCRST_MAG31-925 [uncultured Sphingomonas sp.]